jgi:quinol monooxygenase YgiN
VETDQLTVVAVFRTRPEDAMPLRVALQAMLVPTRREVGCVNYDLHEAIDDPGLFFFHETWESTDHHRAHLDTPHVRQLLTIVPKLLIEPIYELKGGRVES